METKEILADENLSYKYEGVAYYFPANAVQFQSSQTKPYVYKSIYPYLSWEDGIKQKHTLNFKKSTSVTLRWPLGFKGQIKGTQAREFKTFLLCYHYISNEKQIEFNIETTLKEPNCATWVEVRFTFKMVEDDEVLVNGEKQGHLTAEVVRFCKVPLDLNVQLHNLQKQSRHFKQEEVAFDGLQRFFRAGYNDDEIFKAYFELIHEKNIEHSK